MMKLLYILFFIGLNFLIFSYLTKRIEINSKIRTWIIASLVIIALIHFSNLIKTSIDNNLLFILFGFSMAYFVFYFGKIISVTVASNTIHDNNKFKTRAIKWFEFQIDYIASLMILIFQIITIISN